MFDLTNALSNLSITFDLAATRLDAEAAALRKEADESRQRAEEQDASLTPIQKRGPSYTQSAAYFSKQRAFADEAKAVRAEQLATAKRREADGARSGILWVSRESQRSGEIQRNYTEIFNLALKMGRLVWEGSLTDAQPTKNQPSTTGPNPGAMASGTVAGIERRAAATAGEVLTPGVNAK